MKNVQSWEQIADDTHAGVIEVAVLISFCSLAVFIMLWGTICDAFEESHPVEHFKEKK